MKTGAKYQMRRVLWLWMPVMIVGVVLNWYSMTLTMTANGLTFIGMGISVLGVWLMAREVTDGTAG